ncbi:MAG: AAA family ATPase [Nanoarchaeota archaeon]|nr:AAA family ATPase [Nanoarchaeota archaeon]
MSIIGITGGKGGTGKSTVATALAYELAKEYNVLLVDADVDCPNDHLLLGIKRCKVKAVMQRIPIFDLKKCSRCGLCSKACRNNAVVSIKGKYPLLMQPQCNGCGACFFKCPSDAISWGEKEIGRIYSGKNHNINLLSGELAVNEPVSELVVNSLNKIMETKKKQYDFVVIDTAAGTHCPVITALEKCDKVIAVTEPTPLGAHDLKLILDLLKHMGKETRVIVNRSDIGEIRIVKNLLKKYRLGISKKIRFSKKILESYSKGTPIKLDLTGIIGES